MTLIQPPWPSLLLAGPTGSGKTPLGDELERRGLRGRRCIHFDFGANLRLADEGRAGQFGLSAAEEKAVRASLETGALFEEGDLPMIEKILTRFVGTRLLAGDDLLVLNGLPRHRRQAEALAGLVGVERVVSLEAEAEVILERIRSDIGRDRAGRADDDLASVARRLELFRARTVPLLAYYRDRGVPVTTIPVAASMSAEDMWVELDRRIGPAAPRGRP